MKVAVVVPAFNEENRIARVLEAVCSAERVDEVLVVSDGSNDRTAQVAGAFRGVRVIVLPENVGKGGAMCAGVHETDAEIVAFFDADLVGLRPRQVDRLIEPLLNGADMAIGVFRKGRFWSDAAQVITPHITGQRALKRELIEEMPWLADSRMGVEAAITQVARRRKMKIKKVFLEGVTHTSKEQKYGFVKGTAERAKMYAEIGKAIVKTRRKR